MNEKPNEISGQNTDSEWERELAERIAGRVHRIQQAKRSAAEELLAKLERENDAVISNCEAETTQASGMESSSEIALDIEEETEPAYEEVTEAEEASEPVYEEVTEAEEVSEPAYEEVTEAEEVSEPAYEELTEAEEVSEPAYEEVTEAEEVSEPVYEEATEAEEIPSHAAEEADAPEIIPVRAAETEISDEEINLSETKASKKPKKKKRKKKTFGEKLRGLFPQKGDSVLEGIRKVVFLGSVVAIIVCGYIVGDYYLDLWRSSKINEDVMNMYWTYPTEKPEVPTVPSEEPQEPKKIYTMLDGARKLLDINGDVVGVISIPDTPVNNPVMQAENNYKYLDVKIDGTESRNGELFLDYRNRFDKVENGELAYPNSENLVIYGHNMKDDSMFGSLKYYQRNYDYYEKHPLIYFNSNYETYTYKIFAFFIVDAEDKSETKFDCWNKLTFTGEGEYYDFVNEAKRRSLRLTNVDVKYGDPLLTLSTCNTLLGDRGRLIILARLVREGEDPLEGTTGSVENTNIKWPTMYYNSRPNEKYDPDAEFIPYGSNTVTTTAAVTTTQTTETTAATETSEE